MAFPLFSCPSLSGVLPHLLFLQNLPSVVVGHVLDPQPSEIILDMCAAPGDMLLQLLAILKKLYIVTTFSSQIFLYFFLYERQPQFCKNEKHL